MPGAQFTRHRNLVRNDCAMLGLCTQAFAVASGIPISDLAGFALAASGDDFWPWDATAAHARPEMGATSNRSIPVHCAPSGPVCRGWQLWHARLPRVWRGHRRAHVGAACQRGPRWRQIREERWQSHRPCVPALGLRPVPMARYAALWPASVENVASQGGQTRRFTLSHPFAWLARMLALALPLAPTLAPALPYTITLP